MADPRYGYAHQKVRVQLGKIIAAGDGWCAQPECVMPTRWIPPGAPWDVAHDDTGTITIGPAHRRCNTRDGAIRGNRMRRRHAWRL